MHVVYIHQYFVTPDDSGGIRSYEMSRRLLAAGHRVSMICGISDRNDFTGKPGEIQRSVVDGIDLHRVIEPYSNTMGGVRRWMAWSAFARKALRVVKSLKDVDLVFATSTPLTVADPGRKAANFHACPFVFEVRDLWPEILIEEGLVRNPMLKWYLIRMAKRAYRAAARCIALSPGMKEGIAAHGFPEQKIAVVSNSCDLDLFVPTPDKNEVDHDPRFGNPGDFRLVFAGAHGRANGLDDVLDAIGELKKRNVKGVRFCFIGTGGFKPRLMERCREEGLDDYVAWVDQLKKRELARLLPQMDVGLQVLKNAPGFYNGTSPNKFFDYISAGIPVLNNYPGWLGEYLLRHRCGVAVPPNDPAAFADAVVDLMNRWDELKAMGQNGRKLAETVFSRDILGRTFVETLEAAHADFAGRRKK